MRNALRWIMVAGLAAGCVAAGAAEPGFRETLSQAQGHIDAGEYDRALEVLHKLQVDHPDAPLVGYGLGQALYAKGQHQETLGAVDEAASSFAEAQAAFNRVVADRESAVALEAAFAALNAGARRALVIPADQKYGEAVSSLRGAVAGYTQFLREHPGHAGAQKNLDHCQIKLKELLQNPKQGDQKQDEKKDDQKDDQKQPVVYFMNAGTEIPKARAKADGNQLELVLPDAGGGTP